MQMIIYMDDNIDVGNGMLKIDTSEKLHDALFNDIWEANSLLVVSGRIPGLETLMEKAEAIFVSPEYYLQNEKMWKDHKPGSINVFADLHHQDSTRKMLEEIERHSDNKKGVFRLRRQFDHPSIMNKALGDMLVSGSIFGEVKNIHAKSVMYGHGETGHLILALRFEGNVMAHLEYTVLCSNKELLEMEWSSLNTIIEYSTENQAMSYLSKDTRQRVKLDPWSIVENSLIVDASLQKEMVALMESMPFIKREVS
ncbi:hypothetical protein LC085_17255 [Bacillus tianshenii]|uniref:hypothetical protein n=1 Tax=Sutcliffiella tianshenii TaxID=1463404 RepID=UPI001CD4C550|nr:hypothetical protein [Bacillus tianshenii]MCA1321656.1 hypothetical protein [Bacillus tianshenii]